MNAMHADSSWQLQQPTILSISLKNTVNQYCIVNQLTVLFK